MQGAAGCERKGSSSLERASLYPQDQTFEVTRLRQREYLGMVGRGAAGFKHLHSSTGIRRGCGDGGGEIFERNVMRAGAGDERSAGLQQAEGAQVQLFVAAHGSFCGTPGLGKGGGVKHDGVETACCVGPGLLVEGAQQVEGVGFHPIGGGGQGGVALQVGVCDFERGAAGVHAP